MRLLLTFIIFILGGFYTFGKENCCEQCCEYLGNCCKKGKEEVKNENNVGENKGEKGEEEKEVKNENNVGENKEEKGEENEVQEEAKNLVNKNWLDNKKNNGGLVLKIFNKDENENENVNEYKSGNITINLKKEDGKTKITKLVDVEENLKTNGQKWALFEIRYKKGTGNEEDNKEETKYLYCSDIESTLHNGIFYKCKQHVSISVIVCDTSGVTDMHHMFSDCEKLNNLNLSNFNTSNVTNMGSMFSFCNLLENLEFGNKFNTNNVTDMNYMFSFCSSLQTLDLSNFDTNKVTTMVGMFSGCENLNNLILTNFNTGNVANMDNMFNFCASLQTVTFNKNLNNKIIDQLGNLGFKDEPQEIEGNKFVWTKN